MLPFKRLMSALATVCLGLLASCNGPVPDPASAAEPVAQVAAAEVAWDGTSYRAYVDPASRLRFQVPSTGHRVLAQQFPLTTPPVKMKHAMAIAQGSAETVRVEVWHNTERLELQAWFDKYMAFTLSGGAALRRARAAGGVEAIVVDQPRSPQASARTMGFFELGNRVVRVTCLDADSDRAHAVYDKVLETLRTEGAP
jgi:hypothetical protein